ncbi:MAG: NAD(P)-dependent alcohol dehydrogenase [Aquiluna sp.]|nr:NAD(P)-dependent alcohol dehydrogenase [Aquiluna sp.]MCF8545975.1 NAD(P)-dependent alcohol dehydrogenase [Aquiluna sp.]
MKALQRHNYGNWSQLKLSEVEIPEPTKGDVLVRVEFVGVDSSMNHLMTGTPGLVRLGTGFRNPRNPGVGQSFSGIVQAVGSSESKFQIGDRVFGIGINVLADFALAKESKIALVPDWLDSERAASFPVSALAANAALKMASKTLETALVIGGSGSVGSFLLQLLAARGVKAVVSASSKKHGWVESLGASKSITHSQVSELAHSSFDSIFVVGGDEDFGELAKLLKPGGNIVVIGSDHRGSKFAGGFLATAFVSLFSRGKIKLVVSAEKPALLLEVATLLKDATPITTSSHGLDNAVESIRRYQDGQTMGRLVIKVG